MTLIILLFWKDYLKSERIMTQKSISNYIAFLPQPHAGRRRCLLLASAILVLAANASQAGESADGLHEQWGPNPSVTVTNLSWESVTTSPSPAVSAWQAVTTSSDKDSIAPIDSGWTSGEGNATSNEVQTRSQWIFGAGGGVRWGVGEPNYGMIYGRAGKLINTDLSISIRPTYIFGNSDQFGSPNSQGAFQVPVTLDLAPNRFFSPYAGVGIASNTDSMGKVDAMLTGGVDIRVTQYFTLGAGINYIIEPQDADNRDVEAFSILYLRF